MAEGRFVSYLRVSTARQGRSGLGLEAQRAAVASYLNGGRWELIEEIVEVESGKKNDRPALARALASCRLHGAKLVVAKLDRLSRDAAFLLTLQAGKVPFVACDMPDANEMTVGVMALVAQHERKAISERTKAALAAAKARGTLLGGRRPGAVRPDAEASRAALVQARAARAEQANSRASDYGAVIDAIRVEGVTSAAGIAAALTQRSVPLPSGKLDRKSVV